MEVEEEVEDEEKEEEEEEEKEEEEEREELPRGSLQWLGAGVCTLSCSLEAPKNIVTPGRPRFPRDSAHQTGRRPSLFVHGSQ
jgi:hypothetical protein